MAARKPRSKAKPVKTAAKPPRAKKPARKKLRKAGSRAPHAAPARALHYTTLADLRRAIDALDDSIVPLLCRRLTLVASAARFKPSAAGVVIPARVEEIVVRVRALAEKLGSSADCMEGVYRNLIELFTAEEQRNWKKLHGG